MNRTSRKLAFLIASAMGLCLSSCQLLPTLNTHAHVFDQMPMNPQFLATPESEENPATYHYSCVCGAMSAETFCPETHSLNNLIIEEDGDDVKVTGYQEHFYDFRDDWVFVPSGVTLIKACTISHWDIHFVHLPDSLRTIESNAFKGCGVDSIEIPASVTSISSPAFPYCQNLISISVDPANPVYDSRGNCNAVINTADNELVAGCQSTAIPDSVVSIGAHAFESCYSLTSIAIPHSVTSIVENPFGDCGTLSSIAVDPANPVYDSRGNCNAVIRTVDNELVAGCQSTAIPDSVTSIGSGAFYVCTSLTSIAIPDSVVSIDECAFWGATSLRAIEIPSSVTTIGEDAFWCNYALTDVYFNGTEEEWNAIQIGGFNEKLLQANIHFNSTMPQD